MTARVQTLYTRATNLLEKHTMIQIEKNIPLLRNNGKYAEELDAMHTMEVGDSFFTAKITSRAALGALGAIRLFRKKFTIQKEDEGCRIWRIE